MVGETAGLPQPVRQRLRQAPGLRSTWSAAVTSQKAWAHWSSARKRDVPRTHVRGSAHWPRQGPPCWRPAWRALKAARAWHVASAKARA